jgi:hypothetical protein
MEGLNLTGSGADPLFNSYDSRLGSYNPNMYLSSGSIAVLSGPMNLANHTVAGNAFLGVDAYMQGNQGTVTGTTVTGWKASFPDVTTLPTTDDNGNPLPTVWPDAPFVKQNGPPRHEFAGSGYYTIRDTADIHVPAGAIVTVDVEVTTYDMSKSGIYIDGGTTNAGTLIIYQRSGTAAFGGPNSMGAPNNRPQNFQYFGMPDVTGISIAGGATAFQGVFYAPDADLTMNGGGSDVNFMGGFVVKTLTDKGHYLLHYDQSLAGYFYGYFVVGSWKELPPPTN